MTCRQQSPKQKCCITRCCTPTCNRDIFHAKSHEYFRTWRPLGLSNVIIFVSYIIFILHFLPVIFPHLLDSAFSFSLYFILLHISINFMIVFVNIWEQKWNLPFCFTKVCVNCCVFSLTVSRHESWKLLKQFHFQWRNPIF